MDAEDARRLEEIDVAIMGFDLMRDSVKELLKRAKLIDHHALGIALNKTMSGLNEVMQCLQADRDEFEDSLGPVTHVPVHYEDEPRKPNLTILKGGRP